MASRSREKRFLRAFKQAKQARHAARAAKQATPCRKPSRPVSVSHLVKEPGAMDWSDIHGWFDYHEIYDAAVAAAQPGDSFVEIGSWFGRSAAYMGRKILESRKPISFYTVDIGTGTADTERDAAEHARLLAAYGGVAAGVLVRNLVDCGVNAVVTPIVSDSVKAARLFADESLAFVFVDGGHAYETVKADLEVWWPKVRPGGIFAGHDYADYWMSVVQAVDEFFGSTFRDPERHLAVIPSVHSWSVIKERTCPRQFKSRIGSS